MEKEKSKETVQFNPNDYDYMDDMPVDGWFWELIRRSDKYKFKYEEFAIKLKEYCTTSASKKLQIIYESAHYLIDEVNNDIGICEEAFLDERRIAVKILYDDLWVGPIGEEKNDFFKHYLFFPFTSHLRSCAQKDFPHLPLEKITMLRKFKTFGLGLPRPKFKYSDFRTSITPPINHITCSNCVTYEEIKNKKNMGPRILEILAPGKLEDTLYIGITRSAAIGDIEKSLLPRIKKYLKPREVKFRTDKWKYYLIVFDLKEKNRTISYDNIAEILSEAYPYIKVRKGKKIEEVKGYNLFTAENCENFYKVALALIAGDYKKYFYH